MNTLPLKKGAAIEHLRLRPDWEPLLPVETAVLDAGPALRRALAEPVAGPSLIELLAQRRPRNIALVVPDITRDAHQTALVPQLLKTFNEAGPANKRVTILIALGLHRALSDGELTELLGDALADCNRVVQSRADCSAAFFDLGRTRRGTPLLLHRALVEADLRLTLGEVDGHYFAGFSGGRKAVLPGCAARPAVLANHSLVFQNGRRDPAAALGRLTGNPVAEDLAEAQRRLGIDFAVNVVNDADGRLAALAAGEPEAAFHRAVDLYSGLHRPTSLERRSLVIASAGGRPLDIDLRQSHKALDNACRLLAPGGTLVFLADCSEGVGSLKPWLRLGHAEVVRERIAREYSIPGQTAWSVLEKLERFRVLWVGRLIEADFDAVRPSIHATLDDALAELGETAERSAWVIPHARRLLPVWLPDVRGV